VARAKAAPWHTPLRATVLTQDGMAHRRSSSRTPPTFTSLTATRAASQSAANSSSRANNTKNYQNKAVNIWTELLDEGNLTDCPGMSIDSCHPSINSLPLQGNKGSLDCVEAKREPTNHALGVGAQVMSRIPITEGLVDFPTVRGRRPLRFHRARIRRAGGTG
jgi:hypothetical protein